MSGVDYRQATEAELAEERQRIDEASRLSTPGTVKSGLDSNGECGGCRGYPLCIAIFTASIAAFAAVGGAPTSSASPLPLPCYQPSHAFDVLCAGRQFSLPPGWNVGCRTGSDRHRRLDYDRALIDSTSPTPATTISVPTGCRGTQTSRAPGIIIF